MPGRAEPLAQRGELTGYWAIGGDRARLCEHRDDLSRHGAFDRSPASPLARTRLASSTSRRSPSPMGTASATSGAARRPGAADGPRGAG